MGMIMNSLLKVRKPLFSTLYSFSLRRFSATSLADSSNKKKAEKEEEEEEEVQKPTFIHPSAIVHPNALIGQGVTIGPFCTVGSSAKLGNACQFGAVVGDNLPGLTKLGDGNVIGHHAVVGLKSQDLKYKPGDECFLEIGDNNDIREYASIHRSSNSTDQTIIGNNNLIMGSCHIAHDCNIGNNNIFANSTLLAGYVIVEDCTHTAGGIVVHQFCHIGSFSFIGGGSVVTQDVPKFAMVAGERGELRGLNFEGLRRNGFTAMQIRSLRTAYRKIFMPADANSKGIEERLTEVEQDKELGKVPVVCSMVQSLRDSFTENRRGICKFRHWSDS